MTETITEPVALPWEPENVRYGIGFKAIVGDLEIHVFKGHSKRKQPYHFRAELLTNRGMRTIFNSATDPFHNGCIDFRGAKAQAGAWYQRYRERGW